MSWTSGINFAFQQNLKLYALLQKKELIRKNRSDSERTNDS